MQAFDALNDTHSRWLLDVMMEAARDACLYIRSRITDVGTLDWKMKSPADFVSDVDTSAERLIRDRLVAAAGAFGIGATVIGEELSPDDAHNDSSSKSSLTFVVDPLDGTTNYLHGYPWYAVSIGVHESHGGGDPIAGVVLNVATGETFTASVGRGAFRNGQRIAVSRTTEPGRALIGTGVPFKHLDLYPRYERQFEQVVRGTAGVRRAGSAALDLCDVACGRFDAFWELHLAPWDVAAGLIIVREAGGVVTDDAGVRASIAHGPIVAGNREMHAWLLRIVRDAGR